MATRKKPEFDPARIEACLQIIRQLYVDYTPQEIVEAFAINRQEIINREQQAAVQAQIADLTKQLDDLQKP